MNPSPEARLLFLNKGRRFNDPPTRRDIAPTLIWLSAICFAFWAGMLTEEAIKNRRAAAKAESGIYSPAPPAPRAKLDCSTEGRWICKAQERLGKIRKEL